MRLSSFERTSLKTAYDYAFQEARSLVVAFGTEQEHESIKAYGHYDDESVMAFMEDSCHLE